MCNVLDDLHPQHVLPKLDAEVGPRKLVSGSGGVMVSPDSQASGRLVDATVMVIKRESSCARKQTVTLKTLRLKDIMWPKFVYELGVVNDPMSYDSESGEEDGICEYESPPEYPF
ncbi:unnamed protein product [Linum trigynum]|uniref:Uncharacterized protein n=1 Tax=Linum trigynum TaxID=586398 RepID=A0AAV2CIS7_9ROSI